MATQELTMLFHVDSLAKIMIALVGFIGLCVSSFACRYMKGDAKYQNFFVHLVFLISSVGIMVSADHLALLLVGWCISNFFLVLLMIHKGSWKAAKASGTLAAKNYALGSLSVAISFGLIYYATGEASIKALVHQSITSPLIIPALVLLLIGAMTQSAIWPFHKWLISSLNSPTPVSAIMHAGLINGGGFLLVRFAPLYCDHRILLTSIFILGLGTAMLGTLWKLLQNDVKRMLACSTMGQMGFMLAQCGLGLFPSAIAHLVWHGMFKSYLFLASGSASQEKRFDLSYPPKALAFSLSMICGLVGSISFAYASGKSWVADDTTLVLVVVSFLSSSQIALTILREKPIARFPFSLIAIVIIDLAYGASLHLITWMMDSNMMIQPQQLNGVHIAGIIVMILAWLSILFFRKNKKNSQIPDWMLKNYVAALNASQPHPSTITAHRNQYQYD